jgi:hypothetical protein
VSTAVAAEPTAVRRLHPQTVRWLGGAAAAMALYAALRITNVLVLMFFARRDEKTPTWHELLPAGDADSSGLAFFPLYPALSAAVGFLLPVSIGTAMLLVAWAAGLAAAAILYALGSYLRDRMTGILLAALWAVVPHGVVLSMGYSEPLFTALAAGSLLATLRKNWLTAGALCLLAGLTQPTAAAVIVAVGLTALFAVIRDPRQWRAWVAGLLAPLGLVGYLAWAGVRLGQVDGYRGLGGGYTVTAMTPAMSEVSLILLLAVALLVVAIGERLPWQLLAYAGVIVLIAWAGDWFSGANARMLIPAFPLLIPVAYAIRRSRNRAVPFVVIGGLAVVTFLFSVHLRL